VKAELLNVVSVVFNPIRWQSRIALYRQFEQHMLDSGVHLTTVECALGERPFELDNPRVNHVKVRANSILWNKENLINLAIARLPPDWKYVAWLDADILFRQPGWASETVQALQQYHVIQPWESCYDLGPHGEHVDLHHSFLSLWWKDKSIRFGGGYTFAHPGYAWACTRQAFEWLGGLIETAALGAGDHHMALALIGRVGESVPGGLSASYLRHLNIWQARALQHINFSLGFLQGSTIEHFWHGRKEDRHYSLRWDIVTGNQFDPDTDLKRNAFGVLELAGNKPGLEHDLDTYFRQRNEDGNLI
jgi:hypothetical protein